MKGLIKLFVVICVVLRACPVFAGTTVMAEGISIPGVLSASSGWNNNEDSSCSGWAQILLYRHSIQQTNWGIYVNPMDTSQFDITLGVFGLLQNGPSAECDKMTQKVDFFHDGVKFHDWLAMTYTKYPQGPATLNVNGDFCIDPAKLTDSNINYLEFHDWSLPVPKKMWQATFQFKGHFVADTLAEAQAMGAQFNSVPEPSSIVLIFGGLIFAIYLRRRHA